MMVSRAVVATIAIVFAIAPAFAAGDKAEANALALALKRIQAPEIPAANQLGVLEYCQANGYVGGDAVTAQRRLIDYKVADSASIPRVVLHAAENQGRAGMAIDSEGLVPLADAAAAQDLTEEALCKSIGQRVIDAAKTLE